MSATTRVPQQVRVFVTSAEVGRGIPAAPSACPVALAVMWALHMYASPAQPVIDVGGTDEHIRADIDGTELTFAVPRKVRRAVARFDETQEMQPFAFRMRRVVR